jgi:hypothetical protein
MVERIAKIILLVEDINQENLLRRYLQQLGHHNRNMRPLKLPDGRGSGEQFVRERYASEVRAVRAQMTRTRTCLIVMIDADAGSIDDRTQQLERALWDADEPPRRALEPILNLVPKRNVETWILCLNSAAVDEVNNYRHDPRIGTQSIKQAASALFSWTRPNFVLPGFCVPSLRACEREFRRIPGDEG